MRIGGGGSEQSGERCPVGTQTAVLVGVYDIGLQENPFEPGKIQHKVALMWESVKLNTKGAPFTLFDLVTNSSNKKAKMYQRYGCLVGRAVTDKESEEGFDMDPLIGKACLLDVRASKKEGGWPFIKNVMPMLDGVPAPKQRGVYLEEPHYVTTKKAKALTKEQAIARRKSTSVLAAPGVPSPEDAKAADEIFGSDGEKIPF